MQIAILVDDNGTGIFRVGGRAASSRRCSAAPSSRSASSRGQTMKLVDYTADTRHAVGSGGEARRASRDQRRQPAPRRHHRHVARHGQAQGGPSGDRRAHRRRRRRHADAAGGRARRPAQERRPALRRLGSELGVACHRRADNGPPTCSARAMRCTRCSATGRSDPAATVRKSRRWRALRPACSSWPTSSSSSTSARCRYRRLERRQAHPRRRVAHHASRREEASTPEGPPTLRPRQVSAAPGCDLCRHAHWRRHAR